MSCSANCGAPRVECCPTEVRHRFQVVLLVENRAAVIGRATELTT